MSWSLDRKMNQVKNAAGMVGAAGKDAAGFIGDQYTKVSTARKNFVNNYMESRAQDYEDLHYDPKNKHLKQTAEYGAYSEVSFTNKGKVHNRRKNSNAPTKYTEGAYSEIEWDKGPRSKGTLFKNQAKDFAKGMKWSGIMGAGLYGLSAYVSDDPRQDTSDRMVSGAKHAAAFTADLASDTILTGVAAGLSMMGPMGMVAGTALNAFNIFGGFFGMDAGTLVMEGLDHADREYERAKGGPKFNMTSNTSMAMQRQIQNLHASGSNLGEMMHN